MCIINSQSNFKSYFEPKYIVGFEQTIIYGCSIVKSETNLITPDLPMLPCHICQNRVLVDEYTIHCKEEHNINCLLKKAQKNSPPPIKRQEQNRERLLNLRKVNEENNDLKSTKSDKISQEFQSKKMNPSAFRQTLKQVEEEWRNKSSENVEVSFIHFLTLNSSNRHRIPACEFQNDKYFKA